MAPQIQPYSLYRWCVSTVSGMIDHACTNIFLEHGSYDNEDCVSAVEDLQNYYVKRLAICEEYYSYNNIFWKFNQLQLLLSWNILHFLTYSHLRFSLPITIFEHLAEDRNESNRSRSLLTSSSGISYFGSSHHSQCLLWSKDPRIKLSIFLHPHITRFNVDGKGNELMLMQQNDSEGLAGGMGGGLDEFFWCAHLRRLVNLTHLNLNLITTDEILLLGK